MDAPGNKAVSRMTAARRNAEALMNSTNNARDKSEASAGARARGMAAKTERLRELRLGKEAADREVTGPAPKRKPKVKRRRVRSF